MKCDPAISFYSHIFALENNNKAIYFSSICKCCFENKKEKKNTKVAVI